jgi:hypothetical protein
MRDLDVERACQRGRIQAVLLSRGGWVTAQGGMSIDAVFPDEPTLWAIRLFDADGELYSSIFVQAEAIIGISIQDKR